MSSKRKTGDLVSEEGFGSETKRQRVVEEEEEVESSPWPSPLPIANPLSGLANYDDDEEEEEEEEEERQMAEQNGGGEGVENGNQGQGIQEEQEDQIEQGRRNREVERRRDCPYLDTVNRQVYCSSLMLKIN